MKHRSLSVSVVPPSPGLVNNALFESRITDHSSHSPNTHWLDWFAELYTKGRESEVFLSTSDVLPAEEADIVIYMALPNSPHDVVALKQKNPALIAILITYETSLGARYAFNPKNHLGFDAVMTYNRHVVDGDRYQYLAPRAAYYRHRIREGLPFEKRRVACLVGTNRKMRYRTGLFTMRKGWHFSLRDWFDYTFCPGQLVSYRSRVGSACAKYPTEFDIYGEGWELLADTKGVFRGVPSQSTLDYIGNYRFYFAFENHTSDCSLVSERIWDALWGDTVPVYRGHKRIDEVIPRECFVAADEFDSPQQMLIWLRRASEETWNKYRAAGREFIQSEAIEHLLPDAFAEAFLSQVVNIVSSTRTTRSQN